MGNSIEQQSRRVSIRPEKPPVVVEYDCRGQRKSKLFEDGYEGRRFFVAKDKAGKNPKVKSAEPMPTKIKKTKKPKAKANKPAKPYKEFPLYAHPLGYWSKKVDGKIRHFGRWGHTIKGKVVHDAPDGWKDALDTYKHAVEHIKSGDMHTSPVVVSEKESNVPGFTVRDLCNEYIHHRKLKLEAGRIVDRSYDESFKGCELTMELFGKDTLVKHLTPRNFDASFAKLNKRKIGKVRLGKLISSVRSIFIFGMKQGLIKESVNFGQLFVKPSKVELKRERHTKEVRLFTAQEIRQLLEAAQAPQMKAMILLGINCGFGNTDCANLPMSWVDLDKSIIDFPRPKNACDRVCPLWPETVAALREAIAVRPPHHRKEDRDMVFLTVHGNRWVRYLNSSINSVSQEFKKLLKKTGAYRKGVGFYALRHTFGTVANNCDQQFAQVVMGHTDDSMITQVYTHGWSKERLLAVTNVVREWLFEEAK